MPKQRPEQRLYDKRMVERFVDRGLVDEKAYEKHLASLPDLTDQAEAAEVVLESDEDVGATR